ncbi:MAG: InlB B-repeat-containing protein, partial [Ruminococcus sp.]|nr:InlB B-repeat-containing protein [Ruminococcus sp.]
MKSRKRLSMILLVCILLSTCLSPLFGMTVVSAADTDTAEIAADTDLVSVGTDYGLADNIQDGQILQCWCWSYDNIAANMQQIAAQGFSAIQTSPIQASKESTNQSYSTFMSQSWVYYQPISFSIETNSYSALGTKEDFENMCDVAHQYGVKVIVDAVFNHMANDMTENTIHPNITAEIRDNSNCWHDISINTSNYSDRYNITQYCLSGLPDLNTSNSIVQTHCTNFLKECIDAGADGFRFDAVKHIETPSDNSSFASNFWPNVLGAATEYAQSSSRGITPYYYGELLDDPGDGNVGAYTAYMSVTDNQGSNSIRSNVESGNASGAANYAIFNGADPSKTVQWTESHDTHKDSGTANVSEHNINKTWAIVGARDEVCGLYLARPSDMNTTMLGDADQTSWTYPEVRAINQFKNAMIGESEYFSSYGSVAYIERGTRGVVLANVGGTYYNNMSVPAHTIADGTYTDAVTGNTFTVANGNISGNIGDTGIAVVYDTSYVGDNTTDTSPDYSLVGSFNSWDQSANIMTGDTATVSTTIQLAAGDYTFKLYCPTTGIWYGNDGTIEDTTTATSSSGWTMSSTAGDCTLSASGGYYTFNFNTTTKSLEILYSANQQETTTPTTESTTSSSSGSTTTYTLRGEFNNWDGTQFFTTTSDANVITTTLNLEAADYLFKIENSGTWYGNDGTIEDTTTATSSSGWTMSTSAGNCTLSASGGTYTFNFNTSTSKLTVLYTPSVTDPVKTYTVTFKDWDGTTLSTQTVTEGEAATAPTSPTRESDAQYTYTFQKWDTDFSNITADTTVTAVYSQTINKYTVTFKDYDGTTLSTQSVEYGSAATAPQDPTREGYDFSGWDKDFSSITSDITVTATYTESGTKTYTVTFVDYDGTELKTETVISGGSATPPVNPLRESTTSGSSYWTTTTYYIFDSWDGDYTNVTADTTVTATYSSVDSTPFNRVYYYFVYFKDYDGTVLWQQNIKSGTTVTPPADPTREGYTFTGWDNTDFTITAETTFTATYKSNVVATYTVTFMDWDGTVLDTQTVTEGEAATAPANPERAATAQYTYTFKEWDTDFDNITADTTVTATYTQTLNKYTVTFVDWDGTVLSEQQVEYGKSATAPADPTREATAQYTYTFAGWNGSSSGITADTTITATYTQTLNKYTVTFVDWDGTVLSEQQVEYGKSATAPADPTRDGYTFAGWNGSSSGITADTTITATYTQSIIEYTVTFADWDGTGLSEQQVEYGKSATAPAAPTRDGYTFAGWDTDYSSITADTTVTATYTKNVEAVTTGTLKVDMVGGSGFTISIDGGASRPQGSAYVNRKAPVGVSVTVTAKTTSYSEFIGWIDPATGKVLSTDYTYSFYTSGNDYLRAMYRTETEGVNMVVFYHDKGNQYWDIQYYAPTDEISFPDGPMHAGFDFMGWDHTAEEIQAKLAAGEDVTVLPVWERQLVYVSITVN